MEPIVQCFKQIHSPLYDRRLMILILKKYDGRRSFSENCRVTKIKEERRYRHHEPKTDKNTEAQSSYKKKDEETSPDLQFRPIPVE